jgi:TonB family protein
MIRSRKILQGRLGITLLAAALWSQAAIGQESPKPAGWVADFGDTKCSLSRPVGPEEGTLFLLEWSAGQESPSLLIGNRAWKKDLVSAEAPAFLVTAPNGVRTTAVAYPLSGPFRAAKGVALHRVEKGFLDALASADQLSIEVDGRRVQEMALPGTGAAVKTLRTCNQDLLRAFGVDPALDALLKRRPQPIGGNVAQWVTNNDYPDDALRRGASGTTVVRLRIGTEGRVRECVVVATSGDSSIDRQSCAILQRRGRFEPALAADGSSVEASLITSLRWAVASN